MLISNKQHQANIQNAQQSTGPKTQEGKSAARFNALKFGLRSKQMMLPDENAGDFMDLWEDFLAEWQPQTRTERLHLEQMAIAQWMLVRVDGSERLIYQAYPRIEQLGIQLSLLRQCAALRSSYERSFTNARNQLKQAQKERQATKPRVAAQSQPPADPPMYKMSALEDHPIFTAATTDTR